MMAVSKAKTLAMLAAASDARARAYAPYSKFKVGTAVEGGSGKVYMGCNVENASYGLSICAERAAICRAVAEGETEVRTVVIVAGDGEPARPCGACLQFIAEFSPKGDPTVVVTASADLSYDIHTIDDYLPMRFKLKADHPE
jgi:cytidine deaminase